MMAFASGMSTKLEPVWYMLLTVTWRFTTSSCLAPSASSAVTLAGSVTELLARNYRFKIQIHGVCISEHENKLDLHGSAV